MMTSVDRKGREAYQRIQLNDDIGLYASYACGHIKIVPNVEALLELLEETQHVPDVLVNTLEQQIKPSHQDCKLQASSV